MGSCSLLQGIYPTQGSNPGLPTLQADSLPAEPQGKTQNTGVGSLSLLQQIFPTQELNWGLLQCRQILYQLSHQGIPISSMHSMNSVYMPIPISRCIPPPPLPPGSWTVFEKQILCNQSSVLVGTQPSIGHSLGGGADLGVSKVPREAFESRGRVPTPQELRELWAGAAHH